MLLIKLNLIHIACIIAISQALLMAIFLFTGREGNKERNRILSLWFLSFVGLMSTSFLVSYGIGPYVENYKNSIFVVSQLSLLIGPLFYFYVRSLLYEDFQLNNKDSIHFLPFFLVISYIMINFIFFGVFPIWQSLVDHFSNGFFLVQNLIYYILILKLFYSHGFSIKTLFSDKRDFRYNWIRFLIIGSFVMWIAKLQIFIFGFIPIGTTWCAYTITAYFMTLFLFVTSIVYVSLKTPAVFSFGKKYGTTNIPESRRIKIKNQLLKYMNDEKIYLDPCLSLDILANKLSVSRECISQVINEMFHQNFYDFVNQYRVKECLEYLKDKNNGEKTILMIAFESGFNTKATFNAAFKKFTGITPKEFRKTIT